MTAKVLKRSRAKFVSKQTVDQMGISLQELPEKTPDTLSLRQTIERLREPIEAALAKGYSYEELVPMLAQQGINIQPSTLKRYVLSGGDRSTRKRAGAGKTTRQSRKKSGEAASLSVPTESETTVDLVDLTEFAEPEAPATRKRGRGAAKASSESTTSEAPSEPVKSRSRRTSTRAASTAKTRTSSTRGGRKAKS